MQKMGGYASAIRKRASLAVQKANYAVKMYRKVGFEIVGENAEEYIMTARTQEGHPSIPLDKYGHTLSDYQISITQK